MRCRIVIVLFLGIVLGGCGRDGQDVAQLSKFLDRREAVYERINIAWGEAAWRRLVDPADQEENKAKEDLAVFLADDSLNQTVGRWAGRLRTLPNDTLRRRVEIWSRMLKAAKVNNAPEVVTLTDTLKAWMDASDGPGKASAETADSLVLALMKARNAGAQALGYGHYPELVLDATEVDPAWLMETVDVIDSLTRPVYQAALAEIAEKKGGAPLAMSDVQALFIGYYLSRQGPQVDHQASLALMRETVEAIGFDWDALPVQFIEKPLSGGLVGEGLTVRIPGDFRAVLTPDLGFKNRLHELGHGLQLLFTFIDAPILKGYYHAMGGDNSGYPEAVADVIARFCEHPDWVRRHTGQEPSAVDKAGLAAYLRFQLVTILFEWELYQDLDQDRAALNRRLVHRFLGIDPGDAPPPSLASAVFVSYPFFLYAYTVSEVVSWQVHQALEADLGPGYVFDKRVAPWLIDKLYHDGELLPWQARIRRATGCEMDVAGYLHAHGF